jgi:predicted Zn-dependent protease
LTSWASKSKLRRLLARYWRRLITFLMLTLLTFLVILALSQQVDAQSNLADLSPSLLPTPQIHPLPATLVGWNAADNSDYFAAIKPTSVGYLVWSQFPVKVYVEQATEVELSPSLRRFQDWVKAVMTAVEAWNEYLPLQVVNQREMADIVIMRSRPPLQASVNRETGQFNIPRARAAETRYEFYLRQNTSNSVLSQRFTIQLSPDQTVDYTLATARHELGHALGIWGHSPVETDTMYFSQVRNPPSISARDINTIKRIYEQPTRLGWSVTSYGK